MKEAMAIETTAAGGALIKIFGIPVLRDIVFSVLTGLGLVVVVRSCWPSLFENVKHVAVMCGRGPAD